MPMHLVHAKSADVIELVRMERHAFAAKIRVARAVLGWSQSDLAACVRLTQRAIHKLEQGETEPRRTTVRAIEEIWREEGLAFEDLPDGGFAVTVRSSLVERPMIKPARRPSARFDLGVTARRRRVTGYRA